MSLQELVTKYTFDIDTKPLEEVEKKVGDLVGFVGKLGAAGAAAAASVFALVERTAAAGDEALATSQKIGMTVEKLTALQFAAKLSNVEAGNFNVGMRFLAKNMDDASKGIGDAGTAFRKLGVQYKDGSGKLLATDQVLLKLADKLSKMPDGAKKTAMSMDIFGRSGADLIPLLNEGSAGIEKMMARADALGITMSTELAKAGDEFKDSLDELIGGLTGIRNLVGYQLLPVLTPLVKKITEWMIANRKLISTKLEFFMRMLMTFATGVYKIFESLYRITIGLTRLFGGFENTVKILTTAFLIFAGAKILFMIGTLTVALGGLAASIATVNIQALLIPTLIGAAIALLALIIEDVYTFFTDPEAQTFTKDIVDGIKSLWNTLSGMFSEMGIWGKMIVDQLLMPFRMVVNTVKNLAEIYDMITGKVSASQGFSNIWGNVKNAFGGAALNGGSLSESFGFSPSSSPATTSQSPSNSMNNQMQVVNNINVGAGTDPTQVGKSVQQGTKDGIDGALRGAQRSFSKKGGY